ncbi:unnamed protein product [Choristocarpus tenellus]
MLKDREWRSSTIGVTPLLIHPRPGTKVVTKHDSEVVLPVSGPENGGSLVGGQAHVRICSVCTRSAACYTCPRCSIGYCSSSCYKTHGIGCTEAFFRDHIEKELRIEEESSSDTHQHRAAMAEILERLRAVDAKAPAPGELDEARLRGDVEAGDDELQFQEKRLAELALALEDNGKDSVVGGGLGEGLTILTPEEKTRFLREVASGHLGTLIEPWKPWWTQSIASAVGVKVIHTHDKTKPRSSSITSSPSPGIEKEMMLSEPIQGESHEESKELDRVERTFECPRHSIRALFDQTRELPDFVSLGARPPSTALPWLALDVAYSYVRVAHLYNGCWCGDPVGAALTMVAASPVLGTGAQHQSTASALVACVEACVAQDGSNAATHAEFLVKDVHTLCQDPRKITCAFQDAWNLFSTAKDSFLGDKSGNKDSVQGRKHDKRFRRELDRVGKRMRFFTLWSSTPKGCASVKTLANDVLEEVARADLAKLEREAATKGRAGARMQTQGSNVNKLDAESAHVGTTIGKSGEGSDVNGPRGRVLIEEIT